MSLLILRRSFTVVDLSDFFDSSWKSPTGFVHSSDLKLGRFNWRVVLFLGVRSLIMFSKSLIVLYSGCYRPPVLLMICILPCNIRCQFSFWSVILDWDSPGLTILIIFCSNFSDNIHPIFWISFYTSILYLYTSYSRLFIFDIFS